MSSVSVLKPQKSRCGKLGSNIASCPGLLIHHHIEQGVRADLACQGEKVIGQN